MTRGLVWCAAIVCASATPNGAEAKCAGGGDLAYPDPSVLTRLPVNGRIVLTRSSLPGVDFAATEPGLLELRSETDQVRLRVVEKNVGVSQVQFVLAPIRRLLPATRYALWRKADDGGDSPVRGWNGDFAWMTASAPDRSAPRWRGQPKPGGGYYARLGCGPATAVKVNVAVDDGIVDPDATPAVQVRAELQPVDGGRSLRYLITPVNGVVEIGHGMCGGAFPLQPNRRYRVTLTAVDAAGNETPAPGGPFEVTGPAPEMTARR